MIDALSLLLGAALGLLLGFALARLLAERRLAALGIESATLAAALEAERTTAEERAGLLADARKALSDQFAALSAEALRNNNQAFLDVAKHSLATVQETAKGELEQRTIAVAALVKPVGEALEKVEKQLQAMELVREGAYQGLREQTGLMKQLYHEIKAETGNLTRALRAPTVRGRWGEIQLRRVVELAGMIGHCDFVEQSTVGGGLLEGDQAQRLRPDMVIRLPGDKQIVVDAKAPLEAYLDAIETDDETVKRARLADHARAIRAHIRQLSQKAYWNQFESSPEFVVLFLPGEHFFAAALEYDPSLIEVGVEAQVILATPTTLISLLRAVFYGWRQENVTENARRIAAEGRELYKRLGTLSDHLEAVGKSLNGAVGHYNKAIASFDTRVTVSARRLAELDPTPDGSSLKSLQQIELRAREAKTEGAGPREPEAGASGVA